MDNATKAFLIVGEVLIAMLVVGLIVSVIAKFGKFSSNMNSKMQKNKQEEFNNHFYSFQGRIDITAADIVGIANYVKENNDNSELFLKNGSNVNSESPDFVQVVVNTIEENTEKTYNFSTSPTSESEYKKLIKTFLEKNNDKFYCCNATIFQNDDNLDREIDERKNHIVLNESDNGRKGYVKLIKFIPTEIKYNEYLTIYNRNDYVINY